MFPKQGHILCDAYLDWVRSLACWQCDAPAPSQAHHYPPKGRGVTNDLKTMPVCNACHMRCHGDVVTHPLSGERLAPIPEVEQALATYETLFRCLWRGPIEIWAHVKRLADEYRSSRGLPVSR